MRFMIIRKADKETEARTLPSPELLNAMLKYNEEMAKAGVFLNGVGLKPSSKGMRVKFDKGKAVVIDGLFTEVKELIAGFTLIQAKTKEEALEWVKRWPAEDQGVDLEIRPLFEMEDFTQVGTPAIFILLMRLMPVWSKLKAVAHTIPYDIALVKDYEKGEPLPAAKWNRVAAPTLVMDGGKSPAWMRNAMRQLAGVVPHASYRTLEGQTHMLQARASVAPLVEFFGT